MIEMDPEWFQRRIFFDQAKELRRKLCPLALEVFHDSPR